MNVLIASSATGGHLYPALTVADRIRSRDASARILFVGGAEDIGRDLVGDAGYEHVEIDAHGLDRKNPVRALKSLADFRRACGQARKIISGFAPDAVLGTGGYVVGPVAREAHRAGVRVYLQEQNVLPGLANRLSARYADQVFLGFAAAAPHFRDQEKLSVTGNPIREAFAEAAGRRDALRAAYGIGVDAQAVLLFGGSQGADAVNAAGVDLARALAGRAGTQLFFVTGERMYDEVSESVLRAAEGGRPYEHIHIVPYAEKMWELFAVCDLVAARAGALTVTEIAAAGKPSILMPSPNVTNDHQTFNARVLSDAGAAVLLRDAEAAGGGLARETLRLLDDRDTMMKMGAAAQKLYLPGAADRIVDGLFGSSEA